MFNTIVCKGRNALGTLKDHLAAPTAELRLRRQIAFNVLHPQVEIMKRSPTAQIAAGTMLTVSILTGRWATAVCLAGAWCFSTPLTHAVARGVGAVGLVDAKLLAAIERFQQAQPEPAVASPAS